MYQLIVYEYVLQLNEHYSIIKGFNTINTLEKMYADIRW